MKIKTMTATLAAAAALLAAPALAQNALGADGMMPRDEAAAMAVARYHSLDVNGDGVVSENEFVGRVLTVFDTVDANGDQMITRSEVRGKAAQMRQLFGVN